MTITGPHSPEVLLARALDRFGTAPDDVGTVARWLRAAAADVDLPDTAPGDRVVLAGNADGPGLYLGHFVGDPGRKFAQRGASSRPAAHVRRSER